MSGRTSRRGLLGMIGRRAASIVSGEEPDAPRLEPVGTEAQAAEAPESAEAPALSPWERRAQALAAGRPDSVARVLGFACIGGSPSFCSACVEHCPVPGALVATGRAPRVDPDVCTGCGVCEEVCPAPEKAIHVLPRVALGLPPRAGGPS